MWWLALPIIRRMNQLHKLNQMRLPNLGLRSKFRVNESANGSGFGHERLLAGNPDETADLRAEISFGEEFCTLQEIVEGEQLPAHKERFFSLLNTNLIMDIAALVI